ncbi:kinase-like domain-containing protein [Rhizophagus clarus]|uniref:Kinase-like domain-containing protein n=1 Tax=Rhizophagus clarus TaxID=94130 RepID=A0A8H3LKE5_9GLOM|nr:kinase-like domain-containing protein [Rhizophagus clarus]
MSLNLSTQITRKATCNNCKKRRTIYENRQTCQMCYKIMIIIKPKSSGNEVIEDFIKYTQRDYVRAGGKMEYVPYDQFKDIEFIAEGGFSKVYKATWIDGPINWSVFECDEWNYAHKKNYTVVLKNLNNSNNITFKELNELKIFHRINSRKSSVYQGSCKYFGITQDPITKDVIIVISYYNLGDLMHYISNDFYNISWEKKLHNVWYIMAGIKNLHEANIIHKDLHSGNVLSNEYIACISDLGISKSATESTYNNEIYDLIIDIHDRLRPPIVTNAPEGYIELMKECWQSDPDKRPTAFKIYFILHKMYLNEKNKVKLTKIVKSLDIGPVTNNPGAIYKSRPLSDMIQSAMSTRSLSSQSITTKIDKTIKKIRLLENGNNDYITEESELDIDVDTNSKNILVIKVRSK